LRCASRSIAPRIFGLTRTSIATLPVGLRPAPGRRPPRAMPSSSLISNTHIHHKDIIIVALDVIMRKEEGPRN